MYFHFVIFSIKVDCSDTIESLKEKISFRILEPAVNIHVFYQFHEIRQVPSCG